MRIGSKIALPAVLLVSLLYFPALRKPATLTSGQSIQAGEENYLSIRIVFGENQSASRTYDGSIRLSQGRVLQLLPYRFFRQDALVGNNGWKLTTRKANYENRSGRPTSLAGIGASQNIIPAAITAVLDAPETAVATIDTTQGKLEIALKDLKYGTPAYFQGGDIFVERVPTVKRINDPDTGEQHDYPTLVETRAGEVWQAWQAYKERGDHIYARRISPNTSPAMRLTEEKGDLFRPILGEDAEGKLHVIWSERNGQDWNLAERRFDGTSWSPKIFITSGAGNNANHRITSDAQGRLHLVWIAHKDGKSYVAYARFVGGAWSQSQDVSGFVAWAPDIAVDSAGIAYVVWDSYRSGNYDIYLRRLTPDGTPQELTQVTRSPRFQAHPSVAIDSQGRPWLAWDEDGYNWGKDWTHDSPFRSTVLYADRNISIAVFDGGEWKRPKADPNACVPAYIRRFVQLPRIRFDKGGQLWMTFQCRTSVANNREDFFANNGYWNFYIASLSGDLWTSTILPESSSRNEGPFDLISSAAGGLRLCWATDNRLFMGREGLAAANAGQYEVYATSLRPGVNSSPTTTLETYTEPMAVPVLIHPNENGDIERIRSYRIRPQTTELRIVRGDFHRHTEISGDGAGDGSVQDYYRYMIDVAKMDTGIMGDHNMGGDVEYSWWRTEKGYDLYHIRDGFIPLFGYERSVPYPNGHRNIVFDHRGVRTLPISPEENQGKVNSGPILYPYLRQNRGICMEHSLATDQGTDWRDNDPELEPLVEIYQGYHANYEYEGAPLAETANYLVRVHGGYQPAGFFWNALAKGLKLGVQSSSDHISTHTSYAMIYTPSTQRADIVQSMRERHAYGATDNIIVDFQARDGDRTYLMGDIFEARSKNVQLRIKVLGTDTISRLDLIKNNTFALSREGTAKEIALEYADESPRPGENYYYVRVQQIDRNMAWSSPIWIIHK